MKIYKVSYRTPKGERFIKNLTKIGDEGNFFIYQNDKGTIYRLNKDSIILEIKAGEKDVRRN